MKTILLFLLSFLIFQRTYSQCTSSVVPPTVVNGISVTSTFSGAVSNYGSSWTSCGYTTPASALWLGSGVPANVQNNAPFSYTFNFSVPVNNLRLLITATGDTFDEVFTFTTNQGNPTIIDNGSCASTISGNVLTSGAAAVGGFGAGGDFSILTTNNYTSLTISGQGGMNGSLISLCTNSLIIPCTTDDINFIGNNTTICTDDFVPYTVTSPTYGSYSWEDVSGNVLSTNQSFLIPAYGTYIIRTTGATPVDCNGLDTLHVIPSNSPISSFQTDTVCFGLNTTFTNNSSIAAPNTITNSNWTLGDGNSSNLASLTHQYGASGSYNVTLTSTSDFGCTHDTTISVIVNAQPIASFNVSDVCINTASMFQNNSSISSGTFTSLWDFDNTNTSTVQSPNETYTSPNTYNVQLIVTSDQNCKDTITIAHTVSISPNADAGIDTALNCLTNTINLDGSNSSNGGNITYLWTTNTGNITSGSATNTATIGNQGEYYLLVTDVVSSCFDRDTVLVIMDTLSPVIVTNPDTTINCNNPIIELNGSNSTPFSNLDFLWTTNDGNFVNGSTTATPNVDVPGTYNLLITNQLTGCTSTSDVIVNIDTIKPLAVVSPDTSITCQNPSIFLSGINSTPSNINYLWTTNNGNILNGANTSSPEVDLNGEYTLLVTNTTNGCSASDQVMVILDIDAYVNLLYDNLAVESSSILTPTAHDFSYDGDNGSVDWLLNGSIYTTDSSFNYVFSEEGEYEFIVTLTNSINGCVASDTIIITVINDLFIPNGVSDNSDNLNDYFVIKGLELYESNSLSIYNRWGDLVFKQSPYDNKWNGQSNTGMNLSNSSVSGTYFYILTVNKNGENIIYQNYIELKK